MTIASDSRTERLASQRLVATNSNSTLVGDGANDELFGGRGNDTITANGAPSTIYGGSHQHLVRWP